MLRIRASLPWLGVALAGAFAIAVGLGVSSTATPTSGFIAGALAASAIAGIGIVAAFAPAVTISAGIALLVFSGHWDQFGSPVGLDRVVIVAGIVAALVRDLRAPHPRLRTGAVHLLLLALSVYAVMSSLFAGQLLNNSAAFALLDTFGFVPFALFWVAPAAFPGPHERDILMATLVATGLYLGLTAIFEYVGPHALVFPAYILDPTVGIHFGRARGPFTEAAANGLSMFFCAIAAAIAFARWRRYRWIAVACMLVCGVGIIFTLTRQIWLAATFGSFVAIASRRSLRPLLIPAGVGVATLVIAVFSFVPGFSSSAQSRLEDQRPVWDRLNSNAATLRMAETRPLTGFGWWTYADQVTDYYRLGKDRPLTTVGRPHNILLANAAELGVIVTLAWLIALAWAFIGAQRRRGPPDLDNWRVGLIAAAIGWLVVANFTPMGYAFDHALIWLWAGLAWSRA